MRNAVICGILLFAGLLVGTARADDSLNQQLWAAVHLGDKATIESLIAKGADVNAKDGTGRTAIWFTNNYDIVALLIAKGADVNAKNAFGQTPLFSVDNKDIAELLIAKGADVNAKDALRGDTPLHDAANSSWRKDRAEFLIALGANVNARDQFDDTPLHYAVQRYGGG